MNFNNFTIKSQEAVQEALNWPKAVDSKPSNRFM